MPIADVKMTVLGIVNEVERKMGFTLSSALNTTTYTPVLLQLINEVADEAADDGNWVDLRQTIVVTAVTGQATYAIPASGAIVQHITDIAYTGRVPGLQPVTFEVIKLLNRASGPSGPPNQWAAVEVNASGDPVIEVHPIPGTAEASALNAFTVYAETKPRIWVVGDETVVVPFPAMMMVVGLHARALLEENGGEPTRESEKQEARFARMKREAGNRLTADTSTAIRFVPRRGYP